MLSGALAGLLKVGAVALTAGGLATGIYLAVQVGQEEDAQRLQAPTSPTATSALSPPNQVVRPTAQPTTTPTYILAPSPTPPTGVDTSDWKTYSSPDGFSFKYPPDWTVVPWSDELRVVSPDTAQAIADEAGEASKPGMADVTFFFEQSDGFPVNAIIENCELPPALSDPTDQPDTASAVTFLGRRAVQCLQSWREGGSTWLGLAYFVEFSPEKALTVAGRVVPQGAVNLATVEAVIRSMSIVSTQ